MAEEAIPMAVLGVMYIISNKDKKKKKKLSRINHYLMSKTCNYPVDKKRDLLNETNVQTYQGYRNKNENYYQPTDIKRL